MTVARTYLHLLLECETVHDMLIILKERFAPTNQFRELELREQYRKIQRMPRSQNLDSWLQQWERTVAKCIQQKLPETKIVLLCSHL
jgi:hypothetical protein